jgi:hypothetical protein
VPLIRGDPSRRNVARVLAVPASKDLRARWANSGVLLDLLPRGHVITGELLASPRGRLGAPPTRGHIARTTDNLEIVTRDGWATTAPTSIVVFCCTPGGWSRLDGVLTMRPMVE